MPHIHTNPGEHDATACAFIIRTDTDEPKLLLHMHKKHGVLLQPGGHVELNETPWQAIRHEITEETGYELEQLKILQPSVRLKELFGAVLHPQPAVVNTHHIGGQNGAHYHSDQSYVFVTTSDPAGQPDNGESADLRWLNLDELRALDTSEIMENARQIAEFVFTEILNSWQPVELTEFEG